MTEAERELVEKWVRDARQEVRSSALESLACSTPALRRVLAFAHDEANRFSHAYVGTEHFFLALIQSGEGVVIDVLQNLGVDPEVLRYEIEQRFITARAKIMRRQLKSLPEPDISTITGNGEETPPAAPLS